MLKINRKKTTEEVIEEFKEVHGNKYDYSKVDYISTLIPVIIICSIHDEFTQTPSKHKNGSGCPKCVGNIKLTTGEVTTPTTKSKIIVGASRDNSQRI